jgi:hypothetical protein
VGADLGTFGRGLWPGPGDGPMMGAGRGRQGDRDDAGGAWGRRPAALSALVCHGAEEVERGGLRVGYAADTMGWREA